MADNYGYYTTNIIDPFDALSTIQSQPKPVKKFIPNLKKTNSKSVSIKFDDDELVNCHDGKQYPYKECVYDGGLYFHYTDSKHVVKDVIDDKYIYLLRASKIATSITVKGDKFTCEYGYTSVKNSELCIPFVSHRFGQEGFITPNKNINGWAFKESLSEGYLIDFDRVERPISDITYYDQWKNRYNNEDLTDKEKLSLGINTPSYQLTEGVKYSFGIELECAKGFIPKYKGLLYNIACIRDGSLNKGAGGPEIVTGILKGDTGFQHLQKICNELQLRTIVDNYCGLHTHIGGLDFSDQFLINVYTLCQIIEKDVMSVLPPSRRDNQYCRSLKKFKFTPCLNPFDLKLKEDYIQLFKWIGYEKLVNPSFEYNKNKQHPLGYKCGYNHDTPRYCWVNFVPAVFKTRDKIEYKTLEFRNCEGTTNFKKVRNWTLLCLAIVKFADKYPELINNNIGISDILLKIYPKKGAKLVDYFNERRDIFNNPSFDENEWYRNDNKELQQLKTIKDICV